MIRSSSASEREAIVFSSEQMTQNPDPCSIDSLISEVLARIFSDLNIATYQIGCQVSSTWNKQLTIDHLWLGKHLVHHDNIAIGPEKFEMRLGNEIIPFEKFRKHAYESLPQNIIQILNTPCKALPNYVKIKSIMEVISSNLVEMADDTQPLRKIGLTHRLVYIPQLFSLNILKKLFIKLLGNEIGYGIIEASVARIYGDKEIGISGWVLLTKDVLPESTNKNPEEQKIILDKLCNVTGMAYKWPNLVSVIAGLLAELIGLEKNHCIVSNAHWINTRVIELIKGKSSPCVVGIFKSSAIVSESEKDDFDIGLAPMLRCGPADVLNLDV